MRQIGKTLFLGYDKKLMIVNYLELDEDINGMNSSIENNS